MYLLTDMMRMKCAIAPKALCALKSSCSVSEGFKYPITMTKKALPETIDCSAILDESQQCLMDHMKSIARGDSIDILASSSMRCFDLLSSARNCVVTSSPSVGPYVTEFETKKKVRFEIPENDEDEDKDEDEGMKDGLEIPMPLLDLTQIYGPDANPQIDTSVECVTIRGKTYCQVKEMNM